MKANARIVFVSLLALCMAASLFVGCGGQAQGSAAPAGPVAVELWYGLSMTEMPPPPADWKAIQLIRDRLGIDLAISALPSSGSDMDVRINAAAAANALPDIFQVNRTPWVNIVRTGLLGPVDDLFALMPERTKKMYDAEAKAYSTYNGKVYGLSQPGAISRNEGVLIREDWLKKLGLPVPVTLEDYFNVMKAFTEKDPNGNGRADTYGFGAFIELDATFEEGLGRRFEPLLGAFGVAGTWNLLGSNPGLNVRRPEMFDALTFIKRMVDEKVIDPNWISLNKDDFRAAWKQGRFGIMREQNAAWAAESNYAPFDKNFPDGNWIVIDPPRGPTGQRSVGVFPNNYRTYSLSAKAVQAGKGPAIAKLLEWMVDESDNGGYYLLGWGEKGVNYVIGADGSPTETGIPDASKGWSKAEVTSITQLRNLVFYNSQVELVSRYPTYKTATSGKTMSALDALYDMQKRDWTPNDGSNALPTPNADLKRFYEQGVVEFVTGVRPLTQANWAAWVADFDRLGGKAWEDAGIAAARAGGYIK